MKLFSSKYAEFIHPAVKLKKLLIYLVILCPIICLIFANNIWEFYFYLCLSSILIRVIRNVSLFAIILGKWDGSREIEANIRKLQNMSKEFPEQRMSKAEQEARKFGLMIDEKIQKIEEELKKDSEITQSIEIEPIISK